MERPVRSFKSFIQTTPPHLEGAENVLPQIPAPWKSSHEDREHIPTPPSSGASPTPTTDRTASIASWKAPAEWYNDSASVKSTQSLPPPGSAPRTFAPLLPEPSPGMTESEPTSWLAAGPPSASRLLPIYERANGTPDLGPPGSPPRSPFPATPSFSDRSIEHVIPPENRRTNSSSSRKALNTDLRVQAVTRSASDASTKEKAFASLGLDVPLTSKAYDSDSSQRGCKRADRQYLRGKKLRALYKGSPLADDSWEDEDMDDKTRELSFSQDYHDLLADQYQEMNVRAQEVLSTGGAHQVYEAQFEDPKQKGVPMREPTKDNGLVPRPLSWQKGSGRSTPHSQSHDVGDAEPATSPGQKSKHKRLSSFMPHRLSVLEPNTSEGPKKERRPSKTKHIPIPDSSVDKALDDDLRFSKFFPSSKNLKFGKKSKSKSKNTPTTKPSSTQDASSPPQPSPLIRLPLGLAVVRTHSPSPAPKFQSVSDVLSNKSPTSTNTRESTHYESDYSRSNSDHRSSYNSRHSTSQIQSAPANIPPAMRAAYRTSRNSSYSQKSYTGHRLAQEISPPPLPPAPPVIPSSPPLSPPLSPEALNRFQNQANNAEHRYTPRFIEKAKEARKTRLMEARQDRLKRSIKLLGPTDPGVAQAGYVRAEDGFEQGDSDVEGRLPGYMVSGVGSA